MDEKLKELGISVEMDTKIKDYWCNSCGLIGNFSFSCPHCGSIEYSVADFDLAPIATAQELMTAYEQGRLHAVRESGKIQFLKRPV